MAELQGADPGWMGLNRAPDQCLRIVIPRGKARMFRMVTGGNLSQIPEGHQRARRIRNRAVIIKDRKTDIMRRVAHLHALFVEGQQFRQNHQRHIYRRIPRRNLHFAAQTSGFAL